MSQKEDLSLFVREALLAGRPRPEIAEVLVVAGWSQGEVDEALSAWAETPFAVPVPRPRTVVSARDFFVYALTFVALGIAAFHVVWLGFLVVEMLWPDSDGANYWQAREARNSIAAILVAAPLYAWLTVRERRRLAADPGLYRSAIRKWTTYVTLLIAALVFVIDLIVALASFLNGELTGVFVAKVVIVAVVSGVLFAFYLRDTDRG